MDVSVVSADSVWMIEHTGLTIECSSDASFVLRIERKRAGGEEGSFGKLGRIIRLDGPLTDGNRFSYPLS